MTLRSALLAAAIAFAFAFASPSLASAADLSGYWILKTDPNAAPHANLTAAGARKLAEISKGKGIEVADGSVEYARLWCTQFGMPAQMNTGLPLDIRQGPIETAILSSVRHEPRHIYTDGQKHPDMDTFDPISVGHSIGRWQGETLVADTVGFSDKGVLLIPGGGVRSAKSHLVERFRMAGPDTLRVTSTWTDPATLRGAHTYTLEYTRAPGQVWMTEPQCSPIQAMRAKGLPLPPGAPER